MEKKISIRVNKLIYSLIKPSSWNYYLIEKRINYEKRREEVNFTSVPKCVHRMKLLEK
jgi:hypothetical protein